MKGTLIVPLVPESSRRYPHWKFFRSVPRKTAAGMAVGGIALLVMSFAFFMFSAGNIVCQPTENGMQLCAASSGSGPLADAGRFLGWAGYLFIWEALAVLGYHTSSPGLGDTVFVIAITLSTFLLLMYGLVGTL